LNSPPPSFSFIPPPIIPGIVSIGIIFQFSYRCTQYFHYIDAPMPFLHLLPPTSTNPSRQDLFSPPVLWFYKWKKNDIFI
jgi:hypothetical protein